MKKPLEADCKGRIFPLPWCWLAGRSGRHLRPGAWQESDSILMERARRGPPRPWRLARRDPLLF